MSGTQKNLNYKASRSTRLLNNHTKDLFGQQKPVTLFGFDISPFAPNTNQIVLGPGAVYTQNGQRIFAYDDTVTTLTIPSSNSTDSVTCYVVVIEHDYTASTSTNDPQFKVIEVKDWLPRTVEPVKDIQEINIISGNVTTSSPTLYHSTYNTTEGLNIGDFDSLLYTNADPILGYNQTPIAKIIVNWDEVTNVVNASGQFSDYVGIYSYANPFTQIQNYLGFDFFEPTQLVSISGQLRNTMYVERWNDTTIKNTNIENSPYDSDASLTDGSIVVTHYHNLYGYMDLDCEDRTPVNNPLYGYWSNTNGNARYKYSSYLDDGHSIRWNMQRLSESMRIIEAKVGAYSKQPSVYEYETAAPKDIAVAVTGNTVPHNYSENSTPFIIRNGNVGYYQPRNYNSDTEINEKLLNTSDVGDSHHNAIAVLDRAINHVWNDRIGMTGINYNTGATIRKDLYTGPTDTEEWLPTSLSAGSINGLSFKEVISHTLSKKLHRDNGYITTWVHAGTDGTYTRQYIPGMTNESFLTYSTAANAANSATPLHFGYKGIIVQTSSSDDQYGLFMGMRPEDLNSFGINFGTTDLKQRSSILGGENLNVAVRQGWDMLLSVTGGSFAAGDEGKPFKVTWSDTGPVYQTMTGTVVDQVTANRARVRFNNGFGYTTENRLTYNNGYENRYIPRIASEVGKTNSAITVDGASRGNLQLDAGTMDTYFKPSGTVYDSYFNVIDRFTSDPTFQIQAFFGAQYARHISYLPLQMNDWHILGSLSTAKLDQLYSSYSPTTGSGEVIGDTITLAGNRMEFKTPALKHKQLVQVAIDSNNTISPVVVGIPYWRYAGRSIQKLHIYASTATWGNKFSWSDTDMWGTNKSTIATQKEFINKYTSISSAVGGYKNDTLSIATIAIYSTVSTRMAHYGVMIEQLPE